MYRNYEIPRYPSAQLPGEQISQYSPHWEGASYVSDREGYRDRDSRKSYRPQNSTANNYRTRGYYDWNQVTRLPQNNIENQNSFQYKQHSVFHMQPETEYQEHYEDIGHYSRNCQKRRRNRGFNQNPQINYSQNGGGNLSN